MLPAVTLLWVILVTLLWMGIVAGVWVLVSVNDDYSSEVSPSPDE